jgi:hypothetical protein
MIMRPARTYSRAPCSSSAWKGGSVAAGLLAGRQGRWAYRDAINRKGGLVGEAEPFSARLGVVFLGRTGGSRVREP